MKSKNRHFSKIIWCLFITYVIIVVSWWLGRECKKFSISVVELEGEIKYIDPQMIAAEVDQVIDAGFFALDTKSLKDRLEKLPWIDQANVRRVWPNKLAINIAEKEILAKFGNSGLVTKKGEVFYPDILGMAANEKLPIFRGDVNKIKSILEKYNFLNSKLTEIKLNIAELEIMPDSGWRAMLNNGVVLFLGKDALPERTKRFVLAYKGLLQAKIDKVAYVDVRYTNGVSVGWKN